jgi:hypothetical protein
MARVTASFVAESEKVTFDVKYFRPRPKTPSMSYVVGRHDVAASRYDRPERRRMDGEATHRVSLIRSLAGLPINGQLQLVL